MSAKNTQSRDVFKSRWGFILACIGSAVGMANIWRFPVLVSKYGGLTFLIPYFLFVLLIGSTGVIGEFALGRSTGYGPVGAFGRCTELRWGKKSVGEAVGAIPVLGSLSLAIGYTVVLGWIFRYALLAFTGRLYAMGQDMSVIGGTFDRVAADNALFIVIAILVSALIMAMGISGGIEKACKVMMPVLFGLFLLLAVWLATMPGSAEGYRHIFTIDPVGLADPEVWLYAFGQAFFSLSVAGHGSVIYGSYLSDKEDLPLAARNVAVFDTVASLLASLVIIPAAAMTGGALDSPGPGLMFVGLVNVLNSLPGGFVLGVVFFLSVLFAGLTSIINLYEAPVAFLQEKLHLKRFPAVAVIHVIGCAVAVAIQAITSDWMDVVSIYICPLGALLAAVMFFWVAGKDYVAGAVNQGAARPIGGWFYPLGKYVYCIAAAVALIAGALLGGIG